MGRVLLLGPVNSEPEPGHIRAFVAVPVSAVVREAIERELGRWRAALPASSIRWVRPAQLHLTVRFFGLVASAQMDELARAVESAVAGVPPFHLTAEGWGIFPHPRNPRVLWMGVSGQIEVLRQLQQQIESATAAFGEPPEAREFHAHLTLARVKDATAQERDRMAKFFAQLKPAAAGAWRVDQVELIQSELAPEGPRYTCLRSIPLAAN
jgi:2'-5' RNA ligase